MIDNKISYIYCNKEYDSLKKIKLEVENSIGKLIDSANLISPKDRIIAYDMIINNKELLVHLLTEYYAEDGKQKNILDL